MARKGFFTMKDMKSMKGEGTGWSPMVRWSHTRNWRDRPDGICREGSLAIPAPLCFMNFMSFMVKITPVALAPPRV